MFKCSILQPAMLVYPSVVFCLTKKSPKNIRAFDKLGERFFPQKKIGVEHLPTKMWNPYLQGVPNYKWSYVTPRSRVNFHPICPFIFGHL